MVSSTRTTNVQIPSPLLVTWIKRKEKKKHNGTIQRTNALDMLVIRGPVLFFRPLESLQSLDVHVQINAVRYNYRIKSAWWTLICSFVLQAYMSVCHLLSKPLDYIWGKKIINFIDSTHDKLLWWISTSPAVKAGRICRYIKFKAHWANWCQKRTKMGPHYRLVPGKAHHNSIPSMVQERWAGLLTSQRFLVADRWVKSCLWLIVASPSPTT